ncbi:MAG TPA: hypothetical protein VFS37_04395, partial [Conexibacter sp.]|nr:hypothetical protein [Conexibacter sp.]
MLAAGAIALGGDRSDSAAPHEQTVSRAHVALIEQRVEALRGLRFRHPVPVAIVSPAQARREGMAETRRSRP